MVPTSICWWFSFQLMSSHKMSQENGCDWCYETFIRSQLLVQDNILSSVVNGQKIENKVNLINNLGVWITQTIFWWQEKRWLFLVCVSGFSVMRNRCCSQHKPPLASSPLSKLIEPRKFWSSELGWSHTRVLNWELKCAVVNALKCWYLLLSVPCKTWFGV